jgi:hypothetical protein
MFTSVTITQQGPTCSPSLSRVAAGISTPAAASGGGEEVIGKNYNFVTTIIPAQQRNNSGRTILGTFFAPGPTLMAPEIGITDDIAAAGSTGLADFMIVALAFL